jgi:hypothetical protein
MACIERKLHSKVYLCDVSTGLAGKPFLGLDSLGELVRRVRT